MINRLKIIFFFILLLQLNPIIAQKKNKVVTIKGEYTYNIPSHISIDEGKHTALERAKIDALEKEFGSFLTQNTSTISQSVNGETDFRMYSRSGRQVKGEWLETIGEPEYKIGYDPEQQSNYVTVKVTGRAREIVKHKTDLQIKTLKNGTDLSHESTDFLSGDRFYMYFRSPIAGYVAIYLEDDANQVVNCLLPYMSSNEPSVKVEANKDYIFFYRTDPYSCADELTLNSSHTVDYETVYIIFSPNIFTKANARLSKEENSPMELSHEELTRWIQDNEITDKDMQIERIYISVKRKETNEIR